MSFVRNLLAVAIAAVSFNASAGGSWAPDVIGVNLVSYHSNRTYYDHDTKKNTKFQNNNVGLYALWADNRSTKSWRFIAGGGVYANSVYKTTIHVDFGAELDVHSFADGKVLRVGAMAGLASGYAKALGDRTVPVLFNTLVPVGNVFALLPVDRATSVRLSVVPAIEKKATWVVNAAVEARF